MVHMAIIMINCITMLWDQGMGIRRNLFGAKVFYYLPEEVLNWWHGSNKSVKKENNSVKVSTV